MRRTVASFIKRNLIGFFVVKYSGKILLDVIVESCNVRWK